MSDPVLGRIRRVVGDAAPRSRSALLAVSGGVDSMVLLDAARSSWPRGSFAVANFDHASGPHSREAVSLVERVATQAGLAVRIGRFPESGPASESVWREARLTFLRRAAAELSADLFTAHTRDDQVETILFRAMRGAGARGLAGLQAVS